jgi:hypothetical protein
MQRFAGQIAFALSLLLVVGLSGPATATHAERPEIKVLSNRADLVSGGDALVEIVVPDRAASRDPRVELDGRDVSRFFALRRDGRVYGLLRGLKVGPNRLRASLAGGGSSRLTITNHPRGGPIFSGRQVQPWVCTTQDNGLGAPRDKKCNAPAVYEYLYRSTDPAQEDLLAYDPDNPPGDVAKVTTDQGHTVPFIVRRERGTINRGLYTINVLYNPDKPFRPWRKQKAWNGKLYYPFGASCNTNYGQGSTPNVLNERALGKGFIVASSSLNILGQNCNTITSAETLMMVKERIIERYGEIRYTFGSGGSGGAIGQLAVANAYPGLLQGLIPSQTYPDLWTTSTEIADCHLLLNYYSATSPHLWGDAEQQAAVNGHEGVTSCMAWEALFAPANDPSHGCGLAGSSTMPPTTVRTAGDYHPQLNRQGCRATVQDLQVTVWGRRRRDGFAKRPFDNVGVQYGLRALNKGIISVAQFLDLNAKIGGLDIDMNYAPSRSVADRGTPRIAHSTGQVNDAQALDEVAIIDLPATSNVEIHTPFHAFQLERRLVKQHGHGDNHAIWRGGSGKAAFDTMDAWLTAVERDRSGAPLARKIVRNRPRTAVDSCFIDGKQLRMRKHRKACNEEYPHYAEARVAAGAPIASDTMKCRRKPLRRSDYAVKFTRVEWAQLRQIFPAGVCNWQRRGVGQVTSRPWVTFAGGPGGKALRRQPRSVPLP